jgi:glutamate/aspartate transport system permease protein
VLLPMAYRIVIPPLTSEFLNCIKNTSVALTISLMELTAQTRAMTEYTFQSFEAFTAATLIYVTITMTVVFAMRWVERKVAVPGYIGSSTPAAGH